MDRWSGFCRRWYNLWLVTVLIIFLLADAHAQPNSKIEITPTVGHAGAVHFIAFSPDGARVASASLDKTLKLWDVTTGRLIRTLLGHEGDVNEVRFSPDGSRILSGSSDKTVKLWDAATGQPIRTLDGHSDAVSSVAFSPDGNNVLSASARTVKLWDASTARLVRTFEGHSESLSSVAFSPDGTHVVSASGDKTIKLWNVSSGRLVHTFRGHAGRVTAVAFSPNGARIISGSKDSTTKLWDTATGKLIRTFTGQSTEVGISSVAFSPDGRHALAGDQWGPSATLWEIATGRRIHTLKGHSKSVYSVAFSPDGTRILSGSEDRTMKLWHAATGQLIRTFAGPSAPAGVGSVALSPDGSRVIAGSGDMTAKLWDTATGQLIRTFVGHADEVTDVRFSPEGTHILSGSRDETVRVWNVATGQLIQTFTGSQPLMSVRSVAFSPNGSRFVAGLGSRYGFPIESAKTMHLMGVFDAPSGKVIHSLVGHSKGISSVTFSPNGTRILSGSEDRTVKLWDAASGHLMQTFEGHTNSVTTVAFSPDGLRILSGSGWLNWGEERKDHSIRLWDAATGELIRTFAGHVDTTWTVAFSPDGTQVLSGGMDNELKLWDASTGQLVRSFKGHSGWVYSVAFSPQGDRVWSGSNDGTIKVWNAKTGDLMASMFGKRSGEWLAITPPGFFGSTPNASEMISIVRGLELTLIDQVHQSLFNPDLVRDAMAGDPDGEARKAAEVINLERVLDSGPAPTVAVAAHPDRSSTDVVTLQARITDKGKGIGRIEWRVNGVTVAVGAKPQLGGPDYVVSQQLALDPGDNIIEVVAYNGTTLLASLPARTTIKFTGPADRAKAKLHILAIGINRYVDRGWAPPGTNEVSYFPPLGLAVKDAETFGADMARAGGALYEKVRLTIALDQNATRANLDTIVDRLAGEIHPRDTFILFAAAHGFSVDGRFYLIPQDYQGGENPEALARSAIGQDILQDWLANRIKAKKAIVLLDTCRSGALVAGHLRSRDSDVLSEAAIGRLHEATGRPVLTAAALSQDAQEGFIARSGVRHGLFTWALLDALRNGDRNSNGQIELSELVAHVQALVPKLAAELGGAGRSAFAIFLERPSVRQTARFGSRGEDFTVVGRLQ